MTIRDTLVLEFHVESPGKRPDPNPKVRNLIDEMAGLLALPTTLLVKTHNSPKYGMSGWLPIQNAPEAWAIHVYDWEDRDPEFTSIDISCAPAFASRWREPLIRWLDQRWNAKNIVWKTQDEAEGWREIQPDVHRQRLNLRVEFGAEGRLEDAKIATFFDGLCDHLRMRKLEVVQQRSPEGETIGWMHWETSGLIYAMDADGVELDIYTCKPFDPNAAVAFVQEGIGQVTRSREF